MYISASTIERPSFLYSSIHPLLSSTLSVSRSERNFRQINIQASQNHRTLRPSVLSSLPLILSWRHGAQTNQFPRGLSKTSTSWNALSITPPSHESTHLFTPSLSTLPTLRPQTPVGVHNPLTPLPVHPSLPSPTRVPIRK